jgi:hypothetical protein
MLLGCCLHYYKDFSVFMCREADFVTSVSYYPRCCCYRRLIILGVVITCDNYAGVVVSGDKLIAGVMEGLITSVKDIADNLSAVKTTPAMSLTPVYSI